MPTNVVVTRDPTETLDHLLKRFKRGVARSGVRDQMLARRHHDKRVARRKGETRR